MPVGKSGLPGQWRHNRRRFLGGASLAVAASALGSRVIAQDAGTSVFDPASFSFSLEPVVKGLERPVQFIDLNDGSGRFLIVEQTGFVRIWHDGKLVDEPLLDISSQVSDGNEQGLLSIALDPLFSDNRFFYVDYTDRDGNSNIERRRIDADNPDRTDETFVEPLLIQQQPYPNHNGGLLLFGPDRQLYVGFGDGGSQGDPEGNAQNLGTLLGKILRIDVSAPPGDTPYAIPPDNPFVDREDARPEIWSYGLRNPWRFSFDRATGDLYIGDVGQDAWEEVDFQAAGQGGLNFGWNRMEGNHCYEIDPCDDPAWTRPIFAYSHDEGGCSVTGGYVYRGTANPALAGVYLVADYCSGLVWGVGRDGSGAWVASAPVETGLRVSSFGEDASGELYLIDLGGGVFKFTS